MLIDLNVHILAAPCMPLYNHIVVTCAQTSQRCIISNHGKYAYRVACDELWHSVLTTCAYLHFHKTMP